MSILQSLGEWMLIDLIQTDVSVHIWDWCIHLFIHWFIIYFVPVRFYDAMIFFCQLFHFHLSTLTCLCYFILLSLVAKTERCFLDLESLQLIISVRSIFQLHSCPQKSALKLEKCICNTCNLQYHLLASVTPIFHFLLISGKRKKKIRTLPLDLGSPAWSPAQGNIPSCLLATLKPAWAPFSSWNSPALP